LTTVDLPSPEALAAASTTFTAALVGFAVLIVLSAAVAATWARSLTGWALGGVSFVLSQTAQVVVLFLFGPLVAAFTSAPLQEGSRAVILSTAARRMRGERPSVVFGLGHGAMDQLTSSLIPALSAVIILGGITDGSIFVGQSADVADKVRAVAVYLTSQTPLTVGLLITQGALIIGLHVLLTLFVVRAVVIGGDARSVGRNLLLPIAIHTPVAVVRTLFPEGVAPVLLGAFLVAAIIYRRGQGATGEAPPAR